MKPGTCRSSPTGGSPSRGSRSKSGRPTARCRPDRLRPPKPVCDLGALRTPLPQTRRRQRLPLPGRTDPGLRRAQGRPRRQRRGPPLRMQRADGHECAAASRPSPSTETRQGIEVGPGSILRQLGRRGLSNRNEQRTRLRKCTRVSPRAAVSRHTLLVTPSYRAVTRSAWGPFRPCVTVYSTRCPSSRLR